ncbi:TIGR03752 family integrating conjugative element protein [SAR92 clade bacterium H455]|uniref:TIGR03752 family integrating conjugative element protein n=1 Tax=SAR92 clade bacterium H455 TaxID=2974818 RepID=A0ABY5TPL7_9GAMM|nr:TIGR03752 family integrating conjugative element protein [SAR92 clade bacterium H455]
MAEKRLNPLLMGGVLLAVTCLSLVMCSEEQSSYEPMNQVPGYDPNTKREDGDTQTDTIKALQAYAREAVKKADALHDDTQEKMKQVLENQHKVSSLERENQTAKQQQNDTQAEMDALAKSLATLERELLALRHEKIKPQSNAVLNDDRLNEEGLPLGFGFDDQPLPVTDPNQGEWFNPVDWVEPDEGQGSRFTGLLNRPSKPIQNRSEITNPDTEGERVEPVYTIPKDATLTDGLALTALIGRIPVEGETPDPYPVKIYIGKENLLANGHEIPEIEGMIFSGLGFGDWNLSCVNVRLMSATFIFEDGRIVNHSSQGEPLGYISDPSGVPCVSGRFVTNAPVFLTQRVGLAGLGAAGSAYAEAQQQRQTSSLTGSTTSTVVGDINKLVAGEAVQSATDEVSRWLLARQKQSFDAVVVNPGAEVSVHLNRNLAIDKKSLARRLRYAKDNNHTRYGLD